MVSVQRPCVSGRCYHLLEWRMEWRMERSGFLMKVSQPRNEAQSTSYNAHQDTQTPRMQPKDPVRRTCTVESLPSKHSIYMPCTPSHPLIVPRDPQPQPLNLLTTRHLHPPRPLQHDLIRKEESLCFLCHSLSLCLLPFALSL